MTRKLYVENLEMIKGYYLPHSPLDIEKMAEEDGWHFQEDDIGNCYLSIDPECMAFDLVEGFEF